MLARAVALAVLASAAWPAFLLADCQSPVSECGQIPLSDEQSVGGAFMFGAVLIGSALLAYRTRRADGS